MKLSVVRVFTVFAVASASLGAMADTWQEKARDILATTVAMRTAEGHGQVPKMLDYIAAELTASGFDASDIDVEPYGETATLIARYRSDVLNGKRPILFLAHADVVDADPDDWELDPFFLTEKDGYFFGRGVEDNKFGIAMITTVFMKLKAEGFRPDRDLIMVLSGDEETRQETAGLLAAKEELRNAEYALNTDAGFGRLDTNGQPLAYFVQTSEKTYATFELTVRNPGGHSSQPRNDNAIHDLAAAILRIAQYRFPVQVNDTTVNYMSAMSEIVPGEVGEALGALAAEPDNKAAADVLFDRPELVGMTRTTCIVTMLKAGHAENALPQRATATVNCRIFPDSDVERVRRALATAAGGEIEVTLLDKAYMASASPLREDVFEAVRQAVNRRAPDIPVIAAMSTGYTDGSYFRAAGVPTYGVGAVFLRAEDSFAHGLNERVPVASLAAALTHWQVVIKELSGGRK